MTAEESEAIGRKLDQVIRLLAISVTRGLARSEQVAVLVQAGLPVKEIAAALGVKPNTVSVLLYGMRRRPRGGGELRERGTTSPD